MRLKKPWFLARLSTSVTTGSQPCGSPAEAFHTTCPDDWKLRSGLIGTSIRFRLGISLGSVSVSSSFGYLQSHVEARLSPRIARSSRLWRRTCSASTGKMVRFTRQERTRSGGGGADAAGRRTAAEETGGKDFRRWFESLPRNEDVLRIFDRKGHYTVHGEDAYFVAREYYKTNAVVKMHGEGTDALASVGLNENMYEVVAKDLLLGRGDRKIEIYEGNGSKWSCRETASPGKLGSFEDLLFKSQEVADAPISMAIFVKETDGRSTVGAAFVDPTNHRIEACEFLDDCQFCGLEALVVQVGVREMVMPQLKDAEDGSTLRDLYARCGVLCSESKRSNFSTRDLGQDLSKLLKSGSVEHHRDVIDCQCAAAALAGLLRFSEILSNPADLGKYALQLHNTGRFMRLDAAAMRSLHVFPTSADRDSTCSLYGIMNKARSAMGKRLLKVWLKQPLLDTELINERHSIVELFCNNVEVRTSLRDAHLRTFPDTEQLGRKLEKRKATLQDLCHLYWASKQLPLITNVLREASDVLLDAKFTEKLEVLHNEEHLSKFEGLVEASVDLEKIPDQYQINPSYSEELAELAEEQAGIEENILGLLEQAANDLGLAVDKTIKLDWYRASNSRTRCFRITQKEERAVRSKLNSRYQTYKISKDGVYFTNAKLRNAADELQSISTQYDQKQQELVQSVVEIAQTFLEVWREVSAIVAELDILLGFAELAVSAPTPYTRPKVSANGNIVLIGSRHPCVEMQEDVQFIKNDCVMKKGESWFNIITGPNMGGKSTFLRQVAVCVLMAQTGSFVPCDEAEVAVRDCIFTRVGAGDCLLRGVSTFMAEMLETAAILRTATEKSLIIVDELGRGTSTYDGFGLAWAISEHMLHEIQAPVLFATHFHELTNLKGGTGVKNLHVKAAVQEDSGKLTMLYSVGEGACDQSFGIHVAEHTHFPKSVVDLAKRKAKEEGTGCMAPSDSAGPVVTSAIRKRLRVDDSTGAVVGKHDRRGILREFASIDMKNLTPASAIKEVLDLQKRYALEA